MAYNGEADTLGFAEELTRDFLSWFGEDVKYFTNAKWPKADELSSRPILGGWTPATDATFDSGILVLGVQSGVYWVEDED